ncbi:PTS fructose transporter subunit IIC [Pseudoflavonifractor sp. 524-17]|uniref:PTS fructose transporter subunit IIABC n=1 Tax=Pseudoflavonifractor sp. 524-17 TaxID=2304577 RepID=UPI0013796E6B|nr:PTS fructose transporter subunit IIABC [Pseudoflavonifractor sp. 524-17]NCE66153.1 PTS fructose transporter subunit IIC [Pseudoflavonifractor sp. 524-17]
MRITDLLHPDGIRLHAAAADKAAAIDLLADLQERAGNITDKAAYKKAIWDREELDSTAVENGVAVPHARCAAVKRAGLAAMTVPAGVDYGAEDGELSTLLFMIAAPEGGGEVHMEILSHLMVMLMDEEFCRKLLDVESAEQFLSLIDAQERVKFPEEAPAQPQAPDHALRVLAVTACPTGIAHTYMAAEALEKKGRELNIGVKAETQGSGGAKNILTREEIAACDGIIIAADKNVDLARFDGKPLLRTPVSDGINKPQELIERIVDGQAPVYHHEGGGAVEDAGESEKLSRRLYKHLMNGVSHMLPFVIGGGIIMALSFLLDGGAAGTAAFGSSWALPAFFNKVGGIAFGFMVPILAAFIAQSIADRPGLMVGFVGGSLAATGATFAYFADPTVPIIPAGFLGGLLAGFVGGWFMKLLRKACDKLPQSLEGLKPILIYPVVGLLFIGVFMCVVNPFVGMINEALTNALNSMGGSSAIVLGALTAGMMAADMGGPINKAAYVFGTASIAMAAGGFSPVMAAVMAGGMVPPIAIALATLFFKDRFTAEERKSGPVNVIMGLSFITEGAIPFAASDPLHVLPSCIVGSAAAGALSMAFGCASPAPHGGLFVFPVMHNPLGYTAAVAVGSVVGMLLLGLLKKKKG